MDKQLKKFATKLKEAREKEELTHYKTALVCDIPSWENVKQIEINGNPKLSNILKLSKGLDLRINIRNGKITLMK